MRYLIWYFKSLLCKHEWNYEEAHWTGMNMLEQKSSGYKVSATCKHCGWHRKYNKF